MKNFRKKITTGFTLIELLVVISIIGLLAAIVTAAMNSSRVKARDARRVADIRQMVTALEFYFNDCNQYPDGASGLQTSDNNGCPSGTTFGTFLSVIPTNPSPGGAAYTYASTTPFSTYTLTFSLEGATGGFASGSHTASPSGIQ